MKRLKFFLLMLVVVSVFASSMTALVQAAPASSKLKIRRVTASAYNAKSSPPRYPKCANDGIDWTGGYQGNINDLENKWSCTGKGQWIKFQVDKIRTITKIEIAWHAPSKQATWFEAYVSTNDKTWTKVITKQLSHKILPKMEDNFKNQIYTLKKANKGLYVKIVCFGNTDPKWTEWNSIREVKIHGY